MTSRDFLLIACSFGGIQSLFWGLYFLFLNDKKKRESLFLGGLFLALAIRVLKSTYFLFSDDMPMWFINLGFAAHLAVGPLLLYYLLSQKAQPRQQWLFWLHLIPAFLVLILGPWLTLVNFWYRGGYTALLFQSMAYLPWVIWTGWQMRAQWESVKKQWIILLVLGVSVVMIAYFSNYVSRISSYVFGPMVYGGVVYCFSFFLLRNFQMLWQVKTGKYKNIKLDQSRSQEYKERILAHFEKDEPYLENDYTLAKLSERTKIPKHLLSPLFSSFFEMSFTDFLNSHRIRLAQQLLEEQPNLTVSAIAYDCGFNTLSSFNQAFKRFTNTTPSAYRKQLQPVD